MNNRNNVRKSALKLVRVCALALSLTVISVAHSAVIYLNNFGNNGSAIIPVNSASIGWTLLRAQGTGNVADDSSEATTRGGVNFSAGKPATASNVNAPVSLSNVDGEAYLGNSSSQVFTGLFSTSQYTVDRSLYDIDSFQWYANASTADTSQRVAVEIAGNWYVTAGITPPTGSFGNFATSASLFTVNFSSASWFDLTATVGSPFSIGTLAVSLPTGNITSFGLYVDDGPTFVSDTRFDTFTINATAIPEPSTVGLLGVTGFLILFRKRIA